MEPWTLRNLVLDCPEPRELAEFYRRLLGWRYEPGHDQVDPAGDEWLVLLSPGGAPRLAFQRSVAAVPAWSTAARLHLDVAVPDLVAAHRHALRCGAVSLSGTPEEEGHPEDPFRVYADPVGHVFCLFRPPGAG
jgi:Glyoxalase-like domain